MKKIRHILFHLHLHISHIKCQLICGRCFVSLCSHIQMDEINGELDYFQRIFRWISCSWHPWKSVLTGLLDSPQWRGGLQCKAVWRCCRPKGMPIPLRCQVLLWNTEVISLHFSWPAVRPGMKGCCKVTFCFLTCWGNLADGVRWGASPDSWCGNEDGITQGWVQRWHPPTFPTLRIKDTMLWSQILWNSWETCHQLYRAEMCTALLKGFCINCVHANHNHGLFLPVCFGFGSCIPLRKNTAGFERCNRNEKQRELFLPSLPHLSKAP